MRIGSSSHAIIQAPNGKFLVLIGSEWPERPERSLKPDLPGGRVDEGEVPTEAMVREIYEEAGLTVDTSTMQLVYVHSAISTHEDVAFNQHFFYARSTDDNVTLSWEHSDYRWVSFDEFLATAWRPSQQHVLSYLTDNNLWPVILGD